MQKSEPYKLKVCLVGESAVGKTSLIRRFVFEEFNDEYLNTIGTKVTKKNLKIQTPNNGYQDATLIIWDIMGDQGFRQLLRQAYFFGAQGIIGMCDITRKNTLTELEGWLEAAWDITGKVPILFLGNKCDLSDGQEVGIGDIKDFASRFEKSQIFLSSAKTGFNVENAFNSIGQKILENM